jgi:hypothetical protein
MPTKRTEKMHNKQLHNLHSSEQNEVKNGGMCKAWRRSKKGTQIFRYKFPKEETIYGTEGEFKKQKYKQKEPSLLFPVFL